MDKQYVIAKAANSEVMENEINRLIAMGYELYGPLIHFPQGFAYTFYQPMLKVQVQERKLGLEKL